MPRFIRSYAGKARPNVVSAGLGVACHPLAYHSLDVAAACEALLQARPGLLDRVSEAAGLPQGVAQSWIVYAAALHDIGKFADAWQAKLLLRLGREPPFADRVQTDADHVAIGAWLWRSARRQFGVDVARSFDEIAGASARDLFDTWMSASVAHHGLPASTAMRVIAAGPATTGHISAETVADVAKFCGEAAILLGIERLDRDPDDCATSTWLVSGIITLADWIGSNQNWFPYERPEHALGEYWSIARSRAVRAILEAGLRRTSLVDVPNAAALIGGVSPKLTPLQEWAARAAPSPSVPTVAILEDLTGSGKTEASLILAQRWMAAGRGAGLYFGLPTQATANAMVERMTRIAAALFNGKPNIVLAHSATNVATAIIEHDESAAREADHPDGAATASASAAAWIADERRKAFLAEIGVGTIDQALMISLPTRFQPVRAAALADRILIVDEAHSYDAYTTELLCALLRFHATLGGSAIILSATLTRETKSRLLRAFAEGRGHSEHLVPQETAFPLVTLWDGALAETPLEGQRGTRRNLPVKRLETPTEAVQTAIEAVSSGLCAVWIRNTVQDAIDAAVLTRSFAPSHVSVDLFHARYTVGDRAKIERAALARFGRRSTLEARRHRILIATQVVEQSLDVDFDVMISDLAPLDLLIQRSGRLHRHDRGSRDAPLLHVLAPDPEHVVNAAWYASMFPRAAYVYDAHGRLHRGLEAIAHGLNLASDNPRELLEAVLGTDAELHPKLQSNEDSAWARRHAERNVAIQRLLDPNAGYVLRNHFDDDDDTATRLGEETRTLCLARWDGARLMPWNHEDASDNEARAWRLSEISVKRFRAAEAVEPQDAALARAIQTVEDGWGRRGRDLIVMPLQSDGGSWVGVSRSAAGDLLRIVYDDAGLRFDPSPLWRG